jgi:hypothetical protein
MIISISNTYSCHYEIIETIITNYYKITKTNPLKDTIYLELKKPNISFCDYISNKYPNLIINKENKNFDYLINIANKSSNFITSKENKTNDFTIHITTYPDDFKTIYKDHINNPNIFYICHEFTEELLKNKQIYFLTKLCSVNRYITCDILPYQEKQYKNDIPIYIIQGDFRRRDINILKCILNHTFDIEYRIKICCKATTIDINLFVDIDISKLIFCLDKDFQDYHKEFLGCYCIIPLISKVNNPKYYENKLTSSINYGLGYKLKFLIDKDLQNIYNLENAYVYEYDDNSLINIFQQSLTDFNKPIEKLIIKPIEKPIEKLIIKPIEKPIDNEFKDNIKIPTLLLKQTNNKIAVITASFGNTDEFGNITTHDEFDYYFFTDNISKCTNPKITVIYIDISQFPTSLLATKHVKWKTHLYLPNYNYIIWVDVFITHTSNNIIDIKNLCISKKFSLRTQKFTCVNDDIEWCLKNNRIDHKIANNTISYLKQKSFDVFAKSRTYWTSAMIKDNKDINLQNMCDELYYLLETICYRDQQWLPYLFEKYNIDNYIMKSGYFQTAGKVVHESHFYSKNIIFLKK